MVKEFLVDKHIPAGRRLVDLLLQHPTFRLEAALWELNVTTTFWDTISRSWKLVLATPLVHEQGRIFTFDRVAEILEQNQLSHEFPDLVNTLDLVSPSEGTVFMLSLAESSAPLPTEQMLEQTGVGGVWIEGMYIYYFNPHTFMVPEEEEYQLED